MHDPLNIEHKSLAVAVARREHSMQHGVYRIFYRASRILIYSVSHFSYARAANTADIAGIARDAGIARVAGVARVAVLLIAWSFKLLPEASRS